MGLGPGSVQNLGYCLEMMHMSQGRDPCCHRAPSPLTHSGSSPLCQGCCPAAARDRSGGDGLSPCHAEVVLSTVFQLSSDPGCYLQSEAGSSPHAKLQGLCPADKSLQSTGLIGKTKQQKTTQKKAKPPSNRKHTAWGSGLASPFLLAQPCAQVIPAPLHSTPGKELEQVQQ